MVCALDSGLNGPDLSPWSPGHCVVFLGKTFHSHSTALHPGVRMCTANCWNNLKEFCGVTCDGLAPHPDGVEILLVA